MTSINWNVTLGSSTLTIPNILVNSSSSVVFGAWDPDPEPKRRLPPPYQFTLDSDLLFLPEAIIKEKFKLLTKKDSEKEREKKFYKDYKSWRERNPHRVSSTWHTI